MDATTLPNRNQPAYATRHRATAPALAATAPAPKLPRQSRRTNLTDRKLDELAAKRLTKAVDISDRTQKGLVARVRPNGARAFYFKWRPASGEGVARKFRSVRLDAANVAEARKKASEAAAAVAIGRDPRVTVAAFNPASAITVATAISQFKDYLTGKGNTANYVTNSERLLRNHMEPDLGNHRLIDLTQRDIAMLYSKVMAKVTAKASGEAAPEQANAPPLKRRKGRPVDSTKRKVTTLPNRLHTQVKHMLNWATEEGILPPGVAPVVRRPVKIEPSQQRLNDGTKRVLRVGHFARIWLAVEDEPVHVRVLVRLLILLPFRREELTGLMWPWVKGVDAAENVLMLDPSAYTGPRLDVPAWRMKGGKRPQLMPLPSLAVDMLREMEDRRGAGGDHVFSVSAGRTAFAGWQTLMVRLRSRCSDMPERDEWTIHDFRTGVATECGDRLNAEESIIQRLLHHSNGARMGVTWRYDQSKRVDAMLRVLTEWQALVVQAVEAEQQRRDAVATGATATMVALPMRAAE